jgi:hypothetical protein
MTERAYSWDEPVIDKPNEGGGFVLLPAGTYPFTVTKFERSRHEGSAKLPACPKAIVTIEIDGGDLGKTTRAENLFLHSKCEGLLCAFFTSIGHRKHGEPLRMDWGRVVGARGYAKVGVRKFEKKDKNPDGSVAYGESNEVKQWLEPPTNGTAAATKTDPEPWNQDDGNMAF